MTIHLIRHGSTTTSGETYAGRSDIPLNSEGRRMAQKLAVELSDRPITLLLSSPLARAVDTAAPIAKALGLDIHTDPDLMEFDFGIYEGRSKRSLSLKLRGMHARTPVPGGEALIDVWDRAGQILDRLRPIPDRESGEIAIIGHFWINRLLYARAKELDFEAACRLRDYRPATGSVIAF